MLTMTAMSSFFEMTSFFAPTGSASEITSLFLKISLFNLPLPSTVKRHKKSAMQDKIIQYHLSHPIKKKSSGKAM